MITQDRTRLSAPLNYYLNIVSKHRNCVNKLKKENRISRKNKRIIIQGTMTLLVIAMVFIFATYLFERSRIYERCKSSCVYVCTKGGYGRGVILEVSDSEIVVATAHHVSSDWDEDGYIEFVDGTRAFGQRFGADEHYDVEFISVPIDEVSSDTIEKITPVSYVNQNATKCISFSGDKVIKGDVISYDEFMYEFDKQMMYGRMKVDEGMSGAPIFDTKGQLLGMILAGNDEGDFAAVNSMDILKCLGN